MDEDWIRELEDDNFLIVYDVVIDVRKADQLSPENPLIPIWQNIIKFPQLYPGDSVGMRDRYCGQRWNAMKLLERLGLVEGVDTVDAGL